MAAYPAQQRSGCGQAAQAADLRTRWTSQAAFFARIPLQNAPLFFRVFALTFSFVSRLFARPSMHWHVFLTKETFCYTHMCVSCMYGASTDLFCTP